MSIIGDKIHRIRDFRGMTQKQLGMAVGFDEKSADVRIAQYESGTRTPKQALVELLAEALDVNPRFLADDEILGAEITGNRVIPGLTVALALRRMENGNNR